MCAPQHPCLGAATALTHTMCVRACLRGLCHAHTQVASLQSLHSALKPHLLRRVIKDVETSLPPKTERILRECVCVGRVCLAGGPVAGGPDAACVWAAPLPCVMCALQVLR